LSILTVSLSFSKHASLNYWIFACCI
jgi:hypothetical protein